MTDTAPRFKTKVQHLQSLKKKKKKKGKHIPYIFKDEGTGSCICLSRHIHVTRIPAMRMIFTRIGSTLLTCDMYMCCERHIHDLVLSSLKMYGIHLLYFLFTVSLPPPHNPRSHTCLRKAYEGYRIASRDT
jgi:hypothetical protein